jgi:hypothetical protein
MNEWVWNIGGMMQIGTNQSSGRKTVPVNQKSYMDWFGIEPTSLQLEWHRYLLWSLEQRYNLMPAVDHTGVWRAEPSSWQPDHNMYTDHNGGVYVCPLITAPSTSLKVCGPFASMANLNHLRWLHVNGHARTISLKGCGASGANADTP